MVGKMRRYWLLVLMVLGIALTLVISQLVPFPNEHIPIGSTTFFPALFVVHLTGLTLIFLLTALSLESLRRLFSRWMEERIVLQLIILVLVLSIPAFICELVSLGSLQETDSFQGTYVTYRLVKVEETKGLDDDFDLTKINHFVLYACPHGSLICRIEQSVCGDRSEFPCYVHLEFDALTGHLYLMSNDEIVLDEATVAPITRILPISTTRITPQNVKQVAQLGHLIMPRLNGAYWLADGKTILISQHPSNMNEKATGVWLYSLETLETPRFVTLEEPITPSRYWGYAFNATKGLFAVISEDAIYLWDVFTSKRVAQLKNADALSAIAFSSNGQLVAYVSKGSSSIVVYDLVAQREVKQVALSGPYDSHLLSLSSNGNSLVEAGLTGLHKWNLVDFTAGHLNDTPYDSINNAIAFSSDETILGVVNFSINLYDAKTGKKLRDIGGYVEGGDALDFSPDGHIIATTGLDHALHLWNTDTGERLAILAGQKVGDISNISFNSDGTLILTTGTDGIVRLWGIK